VTAEAPRLPPLPELPPKAQVWVAYSGGCDSTVLLHLLKCEGVRRLRAIHVHHGLQAAADDWVQRCQLSCSRLDVPLTVVPVAIDRKHPAGPEGAAREARYAALRGLLQPGDCLVTAHHRDDQAETVLLRLLRGSGVGGVAAMRPLSPFAPGVLWRPLLQVSRSALRAYAAALELDWVEDPHNADPAYARSWLRHEILPRLLQRWPQALDSLARFAGHAAEAAELLDEIAVADLASARLAGGLSIPVLRALSPARRHNLLHYWFAAAQGTAPSTALLQHLEREVLSARADATPRLAVGAAELRRYRDGLYLMAPLPQPPSPQQALPWDGREPLELPPGCGRLRTRRPARGELTVRFVQGGERLRPEGGGRSRSLKNLFQEAGVPVWVRERMPLVYRGDELLAVAGLWRSAAGAASGLELSWEHALPGVALAAD
jgi:tRNA(Ile)-lysidine synthase